MARLNNNTLNSMHDILREVYVQEELPGISAVIVHRRETVWSGSHGYADLEAEKVADLDTVYHLGSVTKVFTAIMLMQLRDVGKLQLDDSLSHYLPEIKQTTSLPITLRQLAAHTSGLPMMPPIPALLQAMQEFPPSLETLRRMTFPTIEAIIDALPEVELLSPPGTQIAYSNLGIALLGHAMERLSGQKYADYVIERILQPLGMKQSGFSATIRQAAKRAVCYLPFSSPPQAAPFATKMIAGFAPAGALWASVNDMSRFLAFLTASPGADASAPIAHSSLEEMCQIIAPLESSRYTEVVTVGGVGIGWFLSRVQTELLAEHGGADPSTATYIGWVPKRNLAVFIATNTGKNPTRVAVAGTALLDAVIQNLK